MRSSVDRRILEIGGDCCPPKKFLTLQGRTEVFWKLIAGAPILVLETWTPSVLGGPP